MIAVVTADDLGSSPAVNRAVMDGLHAGWLTDASVMVTGPAFAELSPSLRGRALGIHLDVSEHAPLTSALDRWLPDRPVAWPIGARKALAHEMDAQVRRALDAGLRITHADSHQHLHWQPVVLDALASVAAVHGIPWVRGLGNVPPTTMRRGVREAATRTRLRLAGLRVTEAFGPAGRVRDALRSGWRVDTLELMCHPGSGLAALEAELTWLRSVDWAELGVRTLSYAALSDLP